MTKNDDLNERVALAIREQLLVIMSEEDIRKKVDEEIETFFNPQKVRVNGYNNETTLKPSRFATIVDEELAKIAGKAVAAVFASPDWQVHINNKLEVTLGPALTRMMKIDPELLSDYAASHVAIQQARWITGAISTFYRNNNQWQLAQALDDFMRQHIPQSE